MYCKTCGGNMYVDKTTVEGTRFDIACLMCGRRKFVDAKTSNFGKLIFRRLLERSA